MREKSILFWLGGLFAVILFIVFVWQQALFVWGDNNFKKTIQNTMQFALSGDWENAAREAYKVREMWDGGNLAIAMKNAETDYTSLNVYLIRFDSAVQQRNAQEVVKEGGASIYLFDNITSIAPKP